ncbi:prepilin peptidase [Streptomyces sp. NPDC002920]
MITTPPSDLLLAFLALVWGVAAGSLLPRTAYRFSVPVQEEGEGEEDEGVDVPEEGWRDACPAGHPLRGWVGRARCAACAAEAPASAADGGRLAARAATPDAEADARAEPSASYGPGGLLLPALTGAVCAALALATGVRPELGAWLLLAPVGVLLAVVDVRVRRLPDPLTFLLAASALALLGPVALLPEHAGTWTGALLGAPALAAAYLLLHLLNPGGLAFGDVKLALGIGAVLGWYGWPTMLLGTFAAFLLGALYGGALVVARRAGRRTTIAFGPFMLVGAFAGLLIGAYTA